MIDKKFIQDKMLRKLIALQKWGGSHTEEINLVKGLPKHLRGEKVATDALEELYDLGFLLTKKSTGEVHVSLNPEKKREIFLFIGLQEEF